MPGAKELVHELQEVGTCVAIVSAGVDLLVDHVASILKVEHRIANGAPPVSAPSLQ